MPQQLAIGPPNPQGFAIAASGLTANTILVLSATAGGIAPAADVTTGWYLSVIAVVKSGTTIYFSAPGLPSGAAS